MVKPIDIWINAMSTEKWEKLHSHPETAYVQKVEKTGAALQGVTPDRMVAIMDEAGVELALLANPPHARPRRMRPGDLERLALETSYKDHLPFLEKYPDRFRGLYGINPWTVMDGLKEMEMAVKEYGFVGAVTHVAGFAPFDDKIWFPFYAKCVELDIPLISQIGHIGSALPENSARPVLIDEVAEFFPELRIVAGHTGWPWCDELIAVALKNANVYIGMEAYAPRYWESSMVKYLDTRGRDKVMWGSDYPITNPKQNLEQVEQLGLREETKRKFLRENAVRVFKLDLPLS